MTHCVGEQRRDPRGRDLADRFSPLGQARRLDQGQKCGAFLARFDPEDNEATRRANKAGDRCRAIASIADDCREEEEFLLRDAGFMMRRATMDDRSSILRRRGRRIRDFD